MSFFRISPNAAIAQSGAETSCDTDYLVVSIGETSLAEPETWLLRDLDPVIVVNLT